MGYVQSSGGFTINVTGAISGTAGEVAFFDSVNSITSSANFLFSGTQVTILGGSAAAPSLVLGSTQSGLYERASGQIGFSVGGVECGFTNGDWSLGVDLNSVVTIKGRTLVGNGAASTQFTIINGSNSTQTYLSGGNTITAGGNIRLDGGTSGGSNKISLRVDATDVLTINSATDVAITSTTGLGINAAPGSTNIFLARRDQNGLLRTIITNASAGGSASVESSLSTNAGDFNLQALSTAAGAYCQISTDAGFTSGLRIATLGAGTLTFYTNSTVAASIDGTTQAVTIGTPATTTIKHALNSLLAATASVGASVLPLTPEGFWVVTINGTDRKIPYYPT